MEYKKDFDKWNQTKKYLNNSLRHLKFQEKEIWWGSVGVNIGSEQDGKGGEFLRPVYVLKKINSNTFIGIPISSKLMEDYAHISFYFNYDFHTAILSQVKVMDKKRLVKRMGITSDYLHTKMKKATIAFILS